MDQHDAEHVAREHRRLPAESEQSPTGSTQTMTKPMRWFLWSATVVAFIAGCSLYLLSSQTDKYFSWTINSALTAAFLGGAYLTGSLVEYLASREQIWARARVVMPAITLVFTPLLLIATLLHFDRFHMNNITGWAWLFIYVVDPVIAAVLFFFQVRQPGGDPPRIIAPPTWLRLMLGVQGAIMLVFGAALFVTPDIVAPLWPWALTQLTARAVGTAVLTMGIVAIHAAWENDLIRIKIALIGYTALSLLWLLAVARYPGEIRWGEPGAWVFLLAVLILLGIGAYGWATTVRYSRLHHEVT